MPSGIATVVFAIGILGLFALDRDPKSHTSKALWIPVVWLLIAGSRMVSEWTGAGPSTSSPDPYLDGSPLDRLFLSGLIAAGVIVLVKRARQVETLLRANGPTLLYFFYCAVSILWSDYPDVASKRWIKALGDLVMVLIVLTDLGRSSAVKRVLTRAGFVLVPLSILLIKYYPDLGRGYRPWIWTPYYTGVTTDKNTLGMICLIFGLGSTWCFLQSLREGEGVHRAGSLIAHGALVAMVIWLFWMANSVTSLCCFLMAGALMAVIRLARKPAVMHLLVAAVLSVSFSALFLNIGAGLVEDLGRDSTLTGRTGIWKVVLSMTGNPLVGTGFESFWLGQRLQRIWSIYWWHVNEAHNGYLEIFLNLGWIGVTLLAVVMITGYRNVVAEVRRDPNAGRLKLAFFVAAVAYNFTESAFRTMNLVWIIFLLAITVVPEAPFRRFAPTRYRLRRQLPRVCTTS